MFTVFIVVFLVMSVTVAIMAIGVMFGREPIKGSCGGLNNVGVERACGCKDVCEQKSEAGESVAKPSATESPSVYRPPN